MSDREHRWFSWMIAAQAGDRGAYNRLLTEVGDRVRRFAKRRLARSGFALDEVEDIVQEALVAVHTKRDTWDASRPIAPWVDAIIRYKTLDALRRLGRNAAKTEVFDPAEQDVAAPPSGDPARYIGDLDRHLGALPRRERGVVAALGLEGLSAAKCAERLGITEIAVRVAFHRGLNRLARLANGEPAADRAPRGLPQ